MKTIPRGSAARAKSEIEHSNKLAQVDTDKVWGWGTPGGRLRAKRRAEFIAQGANLRAGVRALEIGCGTGMFTELFAKTGAQLIAIDISPDLLGKARKRNVPEHKAEFIESRFEDCGIHGPFDAVIGSSVLHHLEIEQALPKIFDLLKPGGYMAFAEPNMLNPQVLMERTFSHWPIFSYVSADETAFVRWRLRKLLLQVGFANVVIVPFDWLHPATPRVLIGLVGALGDILEKTPILREFSGSLFVQCRRPKA